MPLTILINDGTAVRFSVESSSIRLHAEDVITPMHLTIVFLVFLADGLEPGDWRHHIRAVRLQHQSIVNKAPGAKQAF